MCSQWRVRQSCASYDVGENPYVVDGYELVHRHAVLTCAAKPISIVEGELRTYGHRGERPGRTRVPVEYYSFDVGQFEAVQPPPCGGRAGAKTSSHLDLQAGDLGPG